MFQRNARGDVGSGLPGREGHSFEMDLDPHLPGVDFFLYIYRQGRVIRLEQNPHVGDNYYQGVLYVREGTNKQIKIKMEKK